MNRKIKKRIRNFLLPSNHTNLSASTYNTERNILKFSLQRRWKHELDGTKK